MSRPLHDPVTLGAYVDCELAPRDAEVFENHVRDCGVCARDLRTMRRLRARLRGEAYSEGIETIMEHGSTIRVYSLAKTITDCFKFRHKVGLDVALEALKEAWRQRKLNIDEVTRYAKINRVAQVMQPYLETVVA